MSSSAQRLEKGDFVAGLEPRSRVNNLSINGEAGERQQRLQAHVIIGDGAIEAFGARIVRNVTEQFGLPDRLTVGCEKEHSNLQFGWPHVEMELGSSTARRNPRVRSCRGSSNISSGLP